MLVKSKIQGLNLISEWHFVAAAWGNGEMGETFLLATEAGASEIRATRKEERGRWTRGRDEIDGDMRESVASRSCVNEVRRKRMMYIHKKADQKSARQRWAIQIYSICTVVSYTQYSGAFIMQRTVKKKKDKKMLKTLEMQRTVNQTHELSDDDDTRVYLKGDSMESRWQGESKKRKSLEKKELPPLMKTPTYSSIPAAAAAAALRCFAWLASR